ncbi:MAG TPA: hypothetical protein VIK91_25940, partial [Nannocystis sp.]
MSTSQTEDIATYSLFPYSSKHKDDPRHMLERMRKYVLAFKYGRGDEGTGRNFEAIVEDLARQGWICPALDGATVITPVPPLDPPRTRRGKAPPEPCWELAQALAGRIAGARAVRLFERVSSVGWVEDQAPPTLTDHVASLRRTREALPGSDERVAVIADLVTRGTEVLGFVLALRAAGFTGPVAALVVAQATGKYPKPLQLSSFLRSRIVGKAGDTYPTREDL